MSDRQFRDEALTILIAGHETSAAALAWSWYLLSQNPDAADRLRQEAHEVLGDRTPAFDDLGKLAFARAIFDETLRLYPALGVSLVRRSRMTRSAAISSPRARS